jgi:DNA-binding beta-propeller fold protein YncE
MNWKHALAVLTLAASPITVFAAEGPYKATADWKIGGEGGWDYLTVDPDAHLLYIARGNRVQIVDTQSGQLKNEITGLSHTHGVALNPDGKIGYISDGGANVVKVFNRDNDAIIVSIPTGTNPDGIVFDVPSKRLFVFNGASKNATVIDAGTNKAVGTIALPGKPEFPVSDGKGTVFVNIEDTNQIVAIDSKTLAVKHTYPIAPCEGPSGLAFDAEHRRLFAVCDGKMAVVDADTGKVVATPTIGDGPDAAGFDPKKGLVFSSNGDGTLTVLKQKSQDEYVPLQTVTTQRGARTMAFDSSNGKVYTVSAQFGPKPAPTAAMPNPRPPVVAGTFHVIVLSPQ